MQALVARKRSFSSAHFYHQKAFSKEKNLATFGRCHTPHGHGHDYVLEVFVQGPIDPETLLVVNIADIDSILFEITDPLDHQHLNFDIPYFADVIPTTENIAHYLREKFVHRLSERHPDLRLGRLRLFESESLWTEIIEGHSLAPEDKATLTCE